MIVLSEHSYFHVYTVRYTLSILSKYALFWKAYSEVFEQDNSSNLSNTRKVKVLMLTKK